MNLQIIYIIFDNSAVCTCKGVGIEVFHLLMYTACELWPCYRLTQPMPIQYTFSFCQWACPEVPQNERLRRALAHAAGPNGNSLILFWEETHRVRRTPIGFNSVCVLEIWTKTCRRKQHRFGMLWSQAARSGSSVLACGASDVAIRQVWFIYRKTHRKKYRQKRRCLLKKTKLSWFGCQYVSTCFLHPKIRLFGCVFGYRHIEAGAFWHIAASWMVFCAALARAWKWAMPLVPGQMPPRPAAWQAWWSDFVEGFHCDHSIN